MMGQWVAAESFTMPILIIGALVGGLIMLALGKNYWYLIPFTLMSSLPAISLAGRNIDLAEFAIVGCTCMFFARVALKKDEFVIFRPTHALLLFAFAWILLCVAIEPDVLFLPDYLAAGGRRMYIKILLGFFAFLVMASRTPTEKDFKWIFILLAIGLVIRLILSFLRAAPVDVDSYYGSRWQQQIIPLAGLGTSLLFARYKPSEMLTLKRIWTIPAYLCMLFLTMSVGRRAFLALIMAIPFLGAFLYKQYRFIVLGAIFGISLLALLSTLHSNNIVHFSSRVQRALSWVPFSSFQAYAGGRYGMEDSFRTLLHELARQEIRNNPIIGRGYSYDARMMAAQTRAQMQGGFIRDTDQVYGWALAKHWHSIILGYPATFGIPMGAAYMLHLIMVWILALRLARALPRFELRQVFVAYVFIRISTTLLVSNSEGDVAINAIEFWWLFGFFFAIYAQVQKERAENRLLQMEKKMWEPQNERTINAQ